MNLTSRRRALQVAVIGAVFTTHAALALDHATDWPAFQGPRGNGSSPETGLLREWPKEGPPVVWRAKIGQGWGQPAIVGDSVFICWTADVNGTGEVAACLDASDGSERWRFAYKTPAYYKRNIGWAKGGVRATPCVSGDHVFTLGPCGHLHCLNRATGLVVWAQDIYSRWSPGEKGYSFSPLVVDGKLILWFGDGAHLGGTEP